MKLLLADYDIYTGHQSIIQFYLTLKSFFFLFTIMMVRDSIIEKIIIVKELEYKKDLIHTLSTKARTDDKLAQWLLERKYSEYNTKRKGGPDTSDDLLRDAIEFVQNNQDSSPLVSTGKKASLRKDTKDLIKKVKDVLA